MMHITVRFFGETELEAAVARLDELEFARAQVTLGPVTCELYGPHILGVVVSGLDELVADLEAGTAHIGDPPVRPFFGHMALAGSATSVASLVGLPASASFVVNETALIATDWTSDVPQYSTVKTWRTTALTP